MDPVERILEQLSLPSPLTHIGRLIPDIDIQVTIKRDDLIHPHICGNKWRKLKYNLLRAHEMDADSIITFGGAYSNHLVAVAAAGHYAGIPTHGFVRTYHHDRSIAEAFSGNKTVDILLGYGMHLHLLHPEEYLLKEQAIKVKELCKSLRHPLIIPEGGTNQLALQGVIEGIHEIPKTTLSHVTHIVLGIGTGGTLAGTVMAVRDLPCQVIGVSPFKGEVTELKGLSLLSDQDLQNLEIWPHSEQSKFGKITPQHKALIPSFYDQYGVLLDPVYTVKVVATIKQKITDGYFQSGEHILLIHTGGIHAARL